MAMSKDERLLMLIRKHPGCSGRELRDCGFTHRWCTSLLEAEKRELIVWKNGWYIKR